MIRGSEIYVVGRAIHVPGCSPSMFRSDMSDEQCCSPEDAHSILGRKGLRYRDAASRLALCAVATAMKEADGWRGAPVSPSAAVVVGCSLGNVDTVASVAEDLMAGGDRSLSPLAAANLSSNNVGAAVSIWFGLTGPSMTLCSGDRAAADALAVSSLLLRSGRCTDVVVVGVEVANATSSALYSRDVRTGRLQTQASAVILSQNPGIVSGPGFRESVGASPNSPSEDCSSEGSAVLSLARRSSIGQSITDAQYCGWALEAAQ